MFNRKRTNDEVIKLTNMVKAFKEENDRLVKENLELKEEIAVLKGKKRKADELCEGCKHYITGERQSFFAKEKYHKCALNRICKDYEKVGDNDAETTDSLPCSKAVEVEKESEV